MCEGVAIPEKPVNEMATADGKLEPTGEVTPAAPEAAVVDHKKFASLPFYVTAILLQISFVGLGIGFYLLLKPILKGESNDKIKLMERSLVPFAVAVILQLAAGGLAKFSGNCDQKYLLGSVCIVGYPLLWGLLFLQGAMYFCSRGKLVSVMIALAFYVVSVFCDYIALKLLIIRLQSRPSSRVANAEV